LAEADTETTARLEAIAGHLPPGDRDRALDGLRLWPQAMDAYVSAQLTS